MQTIADRLQSATRAIDLATSLANRQAHSVQLLAVSKTKSVSEITQAYEVGQRKFGENYVQEGVDKVLQMSDFTDIEWHMIGPIQSNKTKDVACHFDWVQSIDRFKIARRLNEQRPPHLPNLNVCIQVNIDEEESKSGIHVAQLAELIENVRSLERLTLKGLMAIPSASALPNKQTRSFKKMYDLFCEYHTGHPEFDTLSLGMSKDMQLAIEHGSTMVRLGTAIFGSR